LISFKKHNSLNIDALSSLEHGNIGREDEINNFRKNLMNMMDSVIKGHDYLSQLASIVNNSKDIIFTFNKEFRILTWNEGGERLLGYPATEIIGSTIWSAPPLISTHKFAAESKNSINGTIVQNFVLELTTKDGRQVTCSASLTPLRNSQGIISSVSCILQDVTFYKEAEALSRKLAAQTYEARNLRSINALVGGFAHEFNNMIGIIIGNVDLAMDSLHAMTNVEGRLRRIDTVCKRAAEIIKQVLLVGSGTPKKPSVVDLTRLVKEILISLPSNLRHKVDFEICGEDVLQVCVDTEQIKLVVTGLLSNASEAMKESSDNIKIKLTRLNVDYALASSLPALKKWLDHNQMHEKVLSLACLCVKDTGVGIDKESLNHIFEPFYTTKSPGQGSGLGLAVAQAIVHGHGGTITVESNKGKDTSFSVYLPIQTESPGNSRRPFGLSQAEAIPF